MLTRTVETGVEIYTHGDYGWALHPSLKRRRTRSAAFRDLASAAYAKSSYLWMYFLKFGRRTGLTDLGETGSPRAQPVIGYNVSPMFLQCFYNVFEGFGFRLDGDLSPSCHCGLRDFYMSYLEGYTRDSSRSDLLSYNPFRRVCGSEQDWHDVTFCHFISASSNC